MVFQDGSPRTYLFNLAGDVVTYTDENGSVFANEFDAVGRRTRCDITPQAGIGGTTVQSFRYDGLSRVRFAVDDEVGSTLFAYDSLSRLVEESQAGALNPSTNSAFQSFPATEFTFRSGRKLTNVFDTLYRRKQVKETTGGTNIASWEFMGPNRVAETSLGNGLICTWLNNDRTHSAVQSGVSNPAWGNQSSDRLGYDGSGRPITKRYLAGGVNTTTHAYNNPSSVVGCTTAYDPASNKLCERSLHAENRSHLYEPFDATSNLPLGGYDSVDRLRQYQRGTLATGGGQITSAITLPNTDTNRTYDLDGLGNWRRTAFTPVGGALTNEVRQHNGLNEITSVKDGMGGVVPFLYDGVPGASSGNLADDGTYLYFYDALNRLIQVKRRSDGSGVADYWYDALNRRAGKFFPDSGLETDFVYSGWRCITDFNGAEPTEYVWGIYLDELLQITTSVAITTGSGGDATTYPAGVYYPLQDLLYRTLATTDSSGNIVEAYDYDAYGNTLIFNAQGTSSNWFAPNTRQVPDAFCQFLFTGQRYDSETGNYYYKRRYHTPKWGRFLSRDPIGFAGGLMNLNDYAGNDPVNKVDPSGQVQIQNTGGGLEPLPPVNGPGGFQPFPSQTQSGVFEQLPPLDNLSGGFESFPPLDQPSPMPRGFEPFPPLDIITPAYECPPYVIPSHLFQKTQDPKLPLGLEKYLPAPFTASGDPRFGPAPLLTHPDDPGMPGLPGGPFHMPGMPTGLEIKFGPNFHGIDYYPNNWINIPSELRAQIIQSLGGSIGIELNK